jgi:hypothetical protein
LSAFAELEIDMTAEYKVGGGPMHAYTQTCVCMGTALGCRARI